MNARTPSVLQDNTIPELLQAARHERALLAEVDAARSAADKLAAEAHVEATRMEAEAGAALETELAMLEQHAAEQRAHLRTAILAIAENKARHEMDKARASVEEVLNALVEFIMPPGMDSHD